MSYAKGATIREGILHFLEQSKQGQVDMITELVCLYFLRRLVHLLCNFSCVYYLMHLSYPPTHIVPTHSQGINMEGVDLSNLDLRNINFKCATLRGCNLSNSDLTNCVFERADLSKATLDVSTIPPSRIFYWN